MTLYQLGPFSNAGGQYVNVIQKMGYVIRTDGGHTIVVDGGNWGGDADELLRVLRQVTGDQQPQVDLWLFTHVHSDHIDAFRDLAERKALRVAWVAHHFPSDAFLMAADPDSAPSGPQFRAAMALLPQTRQQLIQVGDLFEIDEVRLTALIIPDERVVVNGFNNSGVVYRMECAGQSLLFLGDLGVESGYRLLGMYGDALKSDFCQMAHHGQNGVDFPVYQAIAPRVCLWDAPYWLYENNDGKGFDKGPWKTVRVREWMESLGVKRHYVIKDGTQIIPFPEVK